MMTARNLMTVLASAAAITLCAPATAWAADYDQAPAEAPETCPTRVLVGDDVASYMCMEPVRASVRLGGGPPVMLDVNFALDAQDRADRRVIEQRKLFLRAAYTETLMLYAGRIYRPGQVPDIDLISQWLQEDTDRLIGAGKARILIDTVLIHAG